MLKLAEVTAKDVVYDLGCGDGMIVTAAAKEFGARAVGIDINPVRVKEANERVAKAGVDRQGQDPERGSLRRPTSARRRSSRSTCCRR